VPPDWPLKTSRLTLRPFVAADFDAFDAMHCDEEVARYLYGDPPSPAESRDLLEGKMAGSSWGAEGDWLTAAVVERVSAATVGDLSMQWVSERDRTAEVGFVFGPRHQEKASRPRPPARSSPGHSARPGSTARSAGRKPAMLRRPGCSRSSACGSRRISSRTSG
jgi:hypothetical protein